MADWTDILKGISGGAAGVVEGLTLGAKPFDAWENVRTKDLANDRSDTLLRDLQALQAAKDADLDFYGNQVGALNTGYKKAISGGELDIFGNQQKMDIAQLLSDSNGAFQLGVRAKGLTPGSPEYREFLMQTLASVDPMAGVAAYDKSNVQGMKNQNVNQQAALAMVQGWVRKNGPDPQAQVVQLPDGTIGVLSEGEVHPLPNGDVMVKAAAMLTAKGGPEEAISKGYKDAGAIQATNIKLLQVVQGLKSGEITPAVAVKLLESRRIGLDKMVTDTRISYNTLMKQDMSLATPEEKQAKEAKLLELQTSLAQLNQERAQNQAMANQLVAASSIPRLGGGGGEPPKIAPQGGPSMTTRRPIGDIISQATGASQAPWGQSSAGPNYPTQNTPGPDELGAFLQSLGISP